MWSDSTEHTAWCTPEGWEVSWFPDRFLDRNQAVTAMTLAETYAQNPPPDSRIWVHVRAWRQELHLDDRERP